MCGKTRYKVSGEPVGGVFYCHCNDCKKQTGSPFTIGGVFWLRASRLKMKVIQRRTLP